VTRVNELLHALYHSHTDLRYITIVFWILTKRKCDVPGANLLGNSRQLYTGWSRPLSQGKLYPTQQCKEEELHPKEDLLNSALSRPPGTARSSRNLRETKQFDTYDILNCLFCKRLIT
jgi:hypothetical protein